MKVSVVTFADLGAVKNLKSADIKPVVEKFIGERIAGQILCRRARGGVKENITPVFSEPLFYVVKGMGKLLSFFISARAFEWAILDFLSARKIRKSDMVIFHPALFPRTLATCKKKGITTVGMATVAHPSYVSRLKHEEYKKFGIEYPIVSYPTPPFDYILAFSDFVKETYIQEGFSPENIFVAYSDIDCKRFVPAEKSDKIFRALFIAHTTLTKGVQYLLNAWGQLNLKNAELILAGGYKRIPPKAKEYCDTNINASDEIVQRGSVKNPENLYQSASVFVFPSLTEGNPRVVMEAMACGLPVITTEHAQSIVEDGKTGFVVPIRDVEAIKEKIEFLYQNPDAAERMGKAARKAIEQKKPFGEAVFEICQTIYNKKHI
jgi:glycosyltransferase involved in cell wall biosynthesis